MRAAGRRDRRHICYWDFSELLLWLSNLVDGSSARDSVFHKCVVRHSDLCVGVGVSREAVSTGKRLNVSQVKVKNSRVERVNRAVAVHITVNNHGVGSNRLAAEFSNVCFNRCAGAVIAGSGSNAFKRYVVACGSRSFNERKQVFAGSDGCRNKTINDEFGLLNVGAVIRTLSSGTTVIAQVNWLIASWSVAT